MSLEPPPVSSAPVGVSWRAFERISDVLDLGSRDFWCPNEGSVPRLRDESPPAGLLRTGNVGQLPARRLYEASGSRYKCVDGDGQAGSLALASGPDLPSWRDSRGKEELLIPIRSKILLTVRIQPLCYRGKVAAQG
jgi:hypothetical protein